MKRISTVVLLVVLTAAAAVAQEYKAFRVGLGTGYALPGGDGAKGGVLFYMEPGYRVSDQILVNLRMEFAAMARGFEGADESADFDVSTSGSYTLNGQYYFSNEGFRPFVGLGFGTYSVKAASASFDGQDLTVGSDASKFGFYPRIGFDAGHFQLTIDYNIVSKIKESYTLDFGDGVVVDGEYEQKTSYIGIRLGAFIGGGRK